MPDSDTEKRFDKLENKLDAIHKTLEGMAIQGEQINNLKGQQDTLWRKYDTLQDELKTITRFQASCPRSTIGWVWLTLVPIVITLLGMLYHILRGGA